MTATPSLVSHPSLLSMQTSGLQHRLPAKPLPTLPPIMSFTSCRTSGNDSNLKSSPSVSRLLRLLYGEAAPTPPEPPDPPDPPPRRSFKLQPSFTHQIRLPSTTLAQVSPLISSSSGNTQRKSLLYDTWFFSFPIYPLYQRDAVNGPLDLPIVVLSFQTSSYRGQERSFPPSSSVEERRISSNLLLLRGIITFLTVLLSCVRFFTNPEDAMELTWMNSKVLDCVSSKSQFMVTMLKCEISGVQCDFSVNWVVCGTFMNSFIIIPNSCQFDDLSLYCCSVFKLANANHALFIIAS